MLSEKTILITGASGGIGEAIAEACVRLDATVFIGGRDEAALNLLAERLGKKAIVLCYDITEQNQIKNAFGVIRQHTNQLSGLVNNAGILIEAPLATTRLDDLNKLLQTNTVSAFTHSQLASRLMARQRTGSIVNLCSVIGEVGSAGQSAYATSKAGLSGMTKSFSKELAAIGVRVNGVAPGFIETDMTQNYTGVRRENVLDKISLGRAGLPREVADVVTFLLSEHASYITGQIIAVDGGMSV